MRFCKNSLGILLTRNKKITFYSTPTIAQKLQNFNVEIKQLKVF